MKNLQSASSEISQQTRQGIGSLDRFFADTILKKAGLVPDDKNFQIPNNFCGRALDSEEASIAIGRLMQGARAGHLCLKKEDLGREIESLPASIVADGNTLFPKAPVIRNGDRYYLQKNWVYESYILQHILRLRKKTTPFYFDLSAFEKNLSCLGGKLLPAQSAAVRSVLDRSLTLICGGPGTGKTYTAAHLVKLLFSSLKRDEKRQFRVRLAAPTGKAASHLQSAVSQGIFDPALQIEASTLHMLLKLQPGANRLFMNKKIDADLVIVDEASMIDVSLLAHLLEAIGDNTLLVLIGDPDQLPPVDAGSLFPEMGVLFGIHLAQCVRTEDPYLQQLAEAVKQGDPERFFCLTDPRQSSETLSSEALYSRIDPVVSSIQPDPRECLEKYSRFRILNSIRQGFQGSDAINTQIFQMMQKKGKWWAAPILATVNDSLNQIYNGMTGLLIGQNSSSEAAYFPDPSSGEMRRFSKAPSYELAFCLSVHKAQGSEFEQILALFPEGSENFGRESLYTAITRAKKKISIFGQKEILRKMILSTSRMKSGFSDRAKEDHLV